jgi:ATP-dependent helicase HrpB
MTATVEPSSLPIYAIREAIIAALRASNRLVLTAPTGSGKSTQAPKILHGSGLIAGQIVILQPRRLAARLLGERVASEMGGKAGGLVGYQTRHDRRVGAGTIIRFVTEGLFLRQLQSNPALDGVGAVILDEFHERNLATDTALALVKMLQESKRPDLRLVVMSATLDTQRISQYLACATLETHGRMYPVEIRNLHKRSEAAPWDLAADALADILDKKEPGDVLIFMPGAYEIRRTVERCEGHHSSVEPISVFPLYSELPARQQDEALAPGPYRKVIVSTNVAETSITIPGIRHVIDSGLARINRFDARRGINVLRIETISQASAEQRAGRAGRTTAGTCTRLWTAGDHRVRPAYATPEIQRLDLAEVILQLKSLDIHHLAEFPWLDPPNPAAVEQAIMVLDTLGALAASPVEERPLTPLGRRMARLPMHPRLSRMLIEAADLQGLDRAALWAALISERDILLRGVKHSFADDLPAGPRSDFVVLENALNAARDARFDVARCERMGLNALACQEVDKTFHLYQEAAGAIAPHAPRSAQRASLEAMARCLLAAFPDHLARRRSEANLACVLTGNRRGNLDPQSVARGVGLLLPIEITEVGVTVRKAPPRAYGGAVGAPPAVQTQLSLVTEIELAWVYDVLSDRITQRRETFFDAQSLAVQTAERDHFDDLLISESILHRPDSAAAGAILAEEVFKGNLKLDRWDESVEQWMARARCVAGWFPERKLITYDDDERRVILQEICAGAARYKEIQDRPCLSFVKDALSWPDQQFVEQMAPERIQLPGGWRMRMEYQPGLAPRGRAKIQDFYGLAQSPAVAGGRVRVLLEILAPNMRPIQVTDDLANFWEHLYPTVRKELSRRYPRHKWV